MFVFIDMFTHIIWVRC